MSWRIVGKRLRNRVFQLTHFPAFRGDKLEDATPIQPQRVALRPANQSLSRRVNKVNHALAINRHNSVFYCIYYNI